MAEKFKIERQYVTFYGKKNGSNKNKFNRVNKLASMYTELHKKFNNMAERGMNSCSETYRCAVATLLLMETGIRVGNESSAEGYNTVPHPHAKNQETKFVKTYGLTTLLREHIHEGRDGTMYFYFVGKKQVENTFIVPNNLRRYVSDIYNNCNEDPMFGVTDYQLTKFIKKYVGKQFTPKDFRTLRANIYAYNYMKNWFLNSENSWSSPPLKKEINKLRNDVATLVSEDLNNTKGVCLKSYINADLFNQFNK